jgi:membrane complex biogenesis BtpA family protein
MTRGGGALHDLFRIRKPVLGMLHVPALPGSPLNTLPLDTIVQRVLADAETLAANGIDGWVLENFGDVPFYPRRVPPHTVAFLTMIAGEVKRRLARFALPLGINVLRNDARSAIAIASAVGAEFIRVNIHTGARVTDQGLIESTAHATLRYRKLLDGDVKIFADVDVKHSAPVAVRSLKDEVEEIVARGCADAVIVTGGATGRETALDDIRAAKEAACEAPVFAGSGVNTANVAELLTLADGLIVGTAFKKDGLTANPVDSERVAALMRIARNS